MPRISSSFSTAERSGGSPVELYTIRRGIRTWQHTSGDVTQTVDGVDYTPAHIKRGDIEQKKDAPGISVKVSIALETEVAQALMVETSEPATVSIRKVQSAGDPIMLVLLGDVVSLTFSGDSVELTVATVEHRFKTLIPRVLVQRTCPHALYGLSCGVNKDDFAVSTTVASITGQVIVVAASAAGNVWRNGILRLASGRVLFIADHTTSAVTVWAPIPDELAVSDPVTIYRGCDKSFTTCETVFDNALNFGAFPNLPDRNPALKSLR
jgi:uncharacterized phage protein (TIGR02218 family)